MTSRSLVPAALLALLAAAAPAFGESRPEESVTPLGLVRGADVVAVVKGAAPEPGAAVVPGRFQVRELLRGALRPGEEIPLPRALGAGGEPVVTDGHFVVFLSRRAEGGLELRGGELGLVPLPEVPAGMPEARAVALFRVLVREVGPDGRLADRSRARAVLVEAATSVGPRLRAGAAFDLVREPGLLDGATDAERDALVRAFVAARGGERVKSHLARVLGRLRPDGAAELLAEALFAPGGEAIRPAVGLALADLGDAGALAPFAARANDPSPDVRTLVAGTLGWSGLADARPVLERLLAAAEPAVRLEAAHALGRLRLADAAPALLRRFRSEGGVPAPERDGEVRRALAWALAQCDDPAAWAALGEAATSDDDARFRAHVAAILRDPRRGFVR
jgi:HEAT repeat protein